LFTESFIAMKIYHLAFFVLVQLFACTEASRSPQASLVAANQQKKERGKQAVASLVIKSTDGGLTWQNISEGLPVDRLEGSLFVDDRGFFLRTGNYLYHNTPNDKASHWEKEVFPDNHSIIAPGRSGMFAYDYHKGAFRQKKHGSSEWSSIYENFEMKGILNVFETSRGTVLIVCDRGRGLFRSIDKGNNWKEVTRGILKLAESNGVLMANSINGTMRSTDDGATWETVISEGGIGIDISPIDGGFAAITFNTQSQTRRMRTTYDGGKTWEDIDTGLLPSMKLSSIIQAGDQLFCGHPNGIYRSADKGKTWQLVLPSIGEKVYKLSAAGNVIYAIPSVEGC
jgi:photosystem II stability/assembly factor-like uncharacterized protein